MTDKLRIANNYTASAAAGVGGFDDYIEVDALPPEFDDSLPATPIRGSIAIPITIEWEDEGYISRIETVCTGWEDYPAKKLFIETMYSNGTSGQPATIICAPNSAVMALYQSAQSVQATVAAAETYLAEHGLMHYLSITGACTISVEEGLSTTPFRAGYEQVFRGGHVTRFVLTDVDTDQPALTWNTWGSNTIVWENGAPQFTSGKANMTVELWGTETTLYGSFKLFT